MKILIIHNSYQNFGGEEAVVANEHRLLSNNGHDIDLFQVNNSKISGFFKKILVALNVVYSKNSKKVLRDHLIKNKPDIVHVHNFFPLFSPSIFDSIYDLNIPSVLTLHNFRLICPGAFLLRSGKICEDCIAGSAFQSVLHGCYRNSRFATLPVAWMVDYHRRKFTWKKKVDSFIVLSDFAKEKFVQGGIPINKIYIKPNFYFEERIELEKDISDQGNLLREGALFVGRLSPEKGIKFLLKTWENLNVKLKIIGNGPLLDEVKKNKSPFISVLGRKNREEIRREMSRSLFLILPSEWYENFPMVIIESFANKLPVICSKLGSIEEIIENQFTGLHYNPGDSSDLIKKILWMNSNPEICKKYGENARKTYVEKYSPDKNYKMLMNIYNDTIDKKKSKRFYLLNLVMENHSLSHILGLRIDITKYSDAVSQIIKWAINSESRYVCAANVHMVMEGWDRSDYKKIVNNADLVVSDGMPLVWGLRLLGFHEATRVRGPELMLQICENASKYKIPIGLYGGREESKEKLVDFLKKKCPGLEISCFVVPPFRSLSTEEQKKTILEFNVSKAGIIFAGIGCPKQEYWMADNRNKINAVMIGVGAAFDIFSGRKPSAPRWMQDYGLEWFFRLMIEPRRLWKRYLKHNTRFVFLFVIQWIASIFGYKLFNLRKEN